MTGGVDIAVAVALAVGIGLGNSGVGVARAVGAGVGLKIVVEAGAALGLALTAAAVTDGEVLDGRGFTKVLEGALGGTVTSAFIFARARSAAERSVSAAQLF